MMKCNRSKLSALAFLAASALLLSLSHGAPPPPAARPVPEPLKAWVGWALWKDDHRESPRPYNDEKKPIAFWPSRLNLQVDHAGARFDLTVTVYEESWVPLPGSQDVWPVEVKANGEAVPVVEHDDTPA